LGGGDAHPVKLLVLLSEHLQRQAVVAAAAHLPIRQSAWQVQQLLAAAAVAPAHHGISAPPAILWHLGQALAVWTRRRLHHRQFQAADASPLQHPPQLPILALLPGENHLGLACRRCHCWRCSPNAGCCRAAAAAALPHACKEVR
jgi:hypothetical protein